MFNLPPIRPPNPPAAGFPEPLDSENADEAPDNMDRGEPFGIAVDGFGVISVTDGKGDRLLKYTLNGTLIASLGGPGAGSGQFHKPEGVSKSIGGACLYVSDRLNDRVHRFDPLGDDTLIFGALGNLGASSGGGIVFNQPIGLALDAAGNLYVADRNNNAIEKFGVPTAAPPVLVAASDIVQGLIPALPGGRLARTDRFEVDVPPAALSADTVITIGPPSQTDGMTLALEGRSMQNHALVAISSAVEFGPEGTRFMKPVSLILPYIPTELPNGANPAQLEVCWWNPQAQDWQAMPSTVDASSMVVVAQTTHFSLYQVMLPASIKPQDAPSNNVADVQIACDPLRPNCSPMKFRNLPASARLKIYTLIGAEVADISVDANGDATWLGTNKSGRAVASGIYFVYAEGQGGSKTFKVAVER